MAAARVRADLASPGAAEDFDAFVERYRDRAVRLAFRLLGGDAAAAEDVVQNALLRAHRARAGFRGEARLDTWFRRVLVREVQRHRRWRALRRLWSADPDRTPEAADERPGRDPGMQQRIAAALERLSRSQREVFVLVHLEGVPVGETAAVLGKATGTVKSHLHRALVSLRRELADLAGGAEPPAATKRGKVS